MLREELVDILGRIPEVDHPKVQFVMQNGSMMSLDILVRMEATYLVMRGREAGNQDEGRAFFVPFVDISFLKIERVMTLLEMDAMYSDRPTNVKRAGNVTDALERVTTTCPSSRGWRSASIASRRNSVNSSRNSTPRCARLTSPGRSCVDPPPNSPAVLIEWCGERTGR